MLRLTMLSTSDATELQPTGGQVVAAECHKVLRAATFGVGDPDVEQCKIESELANTFLLESQQQFHGGIFNNSLQHMHSEIQ